MVGGVLYEVECSPTTVGGTMMGEGRMKKQSWPAMLFRSMGDASPDHLSHSQKCLTMKHVEGRNSEQRVRMVVAKVEDESCPIGRGNAWRRLPKLRRRPMANGGTCCPTTAASLAGTMT